MTPIPAPKEVEQEVLEAMRHYFNRDKEALARQIERLAVQAMLARLKAQK